MEDYISSLTLDEMIWLVSFNQAMWKNKDSKVFARACTLEELKYLRALIHEYKLICELVRHPEMKGIALRVYEHPDELDAPPKLLVVISHEHLPWEMDRLERMSRAYALFHKLTTTESNLKFIKHYGLTPTKPQVMY